jgi:hypothetical protein
MQHAPHVLHEVVHFKQWKRQIVLVHVAYSRSTVTAMTLQLQDTCSAATSAANIAASTRDTRTQLVQRAGAVLPQIPQLLALRSVRAHDAVANTVDL